MENKELLKSIIKKRREQLLFDNTSNKKLEIMASLNQKLEKIANGQYDNISFTEEEIDFLLTDSDVSEKSKNRLKIILLKIGFVRLAKEDSELIINQLLKELKLQEKIHLLTERKEYVDKEQKYLDSLIEIIEDDNYADTNNYEKIFDFLKDSFEKQVINKEQYIDLMMFVVKVTSEKIQRGNTEEVAEVINEENEQSIYSDLVSAFGEEINGQKYNFEKFLENNREFLNKYGKIDFIRYALGEFKRLGVAFPLILEFQDNVVDILVGSNRKCLDTIIDFIKEKSVNLQENYLFIRSLFSMPQVFLVESKNHVTIASRYGKRRGRGKRTGGNTGQLSSTSIIGRNKTFLENVKLYEELTGQKMLPQTIGDGKTKKMFWITKSETLKKNLSILQAYGIANNGGIPNAITSIVGVNTEYLIDRYIELGPELYSYVRDLGTSYLSRYSYSGLMFYKIKRAIAKGQRSYKGAVRGISLDFTRNVSYDGIFYDADNRKVVQKNISFVNDEEFNERYHYFEYPDLDFGNIPPKYQFTSFDKLLARITSGEESTESFNDYSLYAEDPFIRSLDNLYLLNNYTYAFNIGEKEKDKQYFYVSRNKVIRMMAFLKKKGQWINSNDSKEAIAKKIKAVILGESILSIYEYIKMSEIIENPELVNICAKVVTR